MSLFPPPPAPKSNLGHYRILSPNAGVRVSPLCLGAMNFGNAWKGIAGTCDKKACFEILDHFYQNGGNFIDTAGNYQDEESEQWIGEWMEKRGVRDQMVIATKFTTGFRKAHADKELQCNFGGNSAKSLHISMERSLQKLKTSYIDLMYVHWWDYTTSIPEVMKALNAMADAGKILYLGISDTPAWIVTKANAYARQHGLRPFSVYQGRWSAADRDTEHEIIPMIQDEGMAMCPWGALGGGKFRTEEQWKALKEGKEEGRQMGGPSEQDLKVSKVLEKIAASKSSKMTSVALAYIIQKVPYVFPIVGGRTVEHLKDNIAALSLKLSKEDVALIDGAYGFSPIFPNNFIFGADFNLQMTAADVALTKWTTYLDVPKNKQAIEPREQKK